VPVQGGILKGWRYSGCGAVRTDHCCPCTTAPGGRTMGSGPCVLKPTRR
jgi:hypothetical protein